MSYRRREYGFLLDLAGGKDVDTDTALQLIIQTLRLLNIPAGLYYQDIRRTVNHNARVLFQWVNYNFDRFPRAHHPSVFFTLRKVPNMRHRSRYDDLYTWLILISADMQESASKRKLELEKELKRINRNGRLSNDDRSK